MPPKPGGGVEVLFTGGVVEDEAELLLSEAPFEEEELEPLFF